jgi:DNA-binding transcriptional LysR family regulator
MNPEAGLFPAFVVLCEELNFTRAAEKLNMSQPTLSRRIKQLETQVGCTLFDRSTRHVWLTPAGHALLAGSRLALADMERGVEDARRASRGSPSRLRLGVTLSGDADLVPSILRSFRERHPTVEVLIDRAPTESHVLDLQRGRIDASFVRLPLTDSDLLDVVPIRGDDMLIVLPDDHPLANQHAVAIEDLEDEALIMFSRGLSEGHFDHIVRHIRPTEDPATVVFQPRPDEEAMIVAVAEGAGFTVATARRIRQIQVPGTIALPLTPALQTELGLAWRKDSPHDLTRSFVELARR